MKSFFKLASICLLLGAAIFLADRIYRATIGTAMCRGISCLSSYAVSKSPDVYKLNHSCILIGSPTGIGIFNDRKFGKFAREILGTEYIFLSREFIFIVNKKDKNDPIIVINDDNYIVDTKLNEICADKIELKINDDKTIQINN